MKKQSIIYQNINRFKNSIKIFDAKIDSVVDTVNLQRSSIDKAVKACDLSTSKTTMPYFYINDPVFSINHTCLKDYLNTLHITTLNGLKLKDDINVNSHIEFAGMVHPTANTNYDNLFFEPITLNKSGFTFMALNNTTIGYDMYDRMWKNDINFRNKQLEDYLKDKCSQNNPDLELNYGDEVIFFFEPKENNLKNSYNLTYYQGNNDDNLSMLPRMIKIENYDNLYKEKNDIIKIDGIKDRVELVKDLVRLFHSFTTLKEDILYISLVECGIMKIIPDQNGIKKGSITNPIFQGILGKEYTDLDEATLSMKQNTTGLPYTVGLYSLLKYMEDFKNGDRLLLKAKRGLRLKVKSEKPSKFGEFCKFEIIN